MLTEKEKEESIRTYEETKRRFEERYEKMKEAEKMNYEFNRIRLLNKLCTIYIPTKPKDFWSNNPYYLETEKYSITDGDCFKHIPEYFLWLAKQMSSFKENTITDECDDDKFEHVTWKSVESTMRHKWSHYNKYTLEEKEKVGIPKNRRELHTYLTSIEELYRDKFKTKSNEESSMSIE